MLEDDAVLSAAIDGVSKIAERLANVSSGVRSRALAAVEQSYRQTARSLGYDERDAQLWASTVMVELQIREEIRNLVGQIANGEPSLIPSPIEEPEKVES
jgi:S-adenosylmethionine synthetase